MSTARETSSARSDLSGPPHPPFPFSPEQVPDVTAEYARRRSECPFGHVALPSGHDAVLLTRHADVLAGLADPRLSRNLTAPGSPRIYLGTSLMDDPEVIGNIEGEAHLRLRRLLSPSFTPRRIATWRPVITEIADDLVDQLERKGPPADIVDAFARQLPARVMYRMLGVPEEDSGPFLDWSNAFALSAKVTDEERREKVAAFSRYVTQLIARRRAEPGDGLIDELIAARDGSDRLSERELQSQVIALIAAGTETTTTMIGRGLLTLLDGDRALWLRLLDDPELIPSAVEELLRYNPLLRVPALRLAVEDAELPSGTVRAGEAVLLALDSAMFDEDAYPEPDTVHLDRDDHARQVAFGSGTHYCLGAHLARAVMQVGFRVLGTRLPQLHLAIRPQDVQYTGGEKITSITELPVRW